MAISFDRPVVCPVLIGRAHLCDSVDRLIEETIGGTGRTVLISGEAGIGKSRLIHEARSLAERHGSTFLDGHSFETDRSLPYAPLIDLLRNLIAHNDLEVVREHIAPFAVELASVLPEIRLLLPDQPLGASPTGAQDKRQLLEAVTRFVVEMSRKNPVVIAFEDIHWSDDSSLEFFFHLARRSASHKVLLLLSYRSDEVHPSLRHLLAELDRERLASEFQLARLGASDTDAMLRAMFGGQRPLPADLVQAVHNLTDGNPFFIEETVRSLVLSGEPGSREIIPDRMPFDDLQIPRSVQDAVQRRLQGLTESARTLIEIAAVAGRRFDFGLLQALSSKDDIELLQTIKELMAAQLVIEESADRFAFRHALTRQAIYGGLLARERKPRHEEIATTMERQHEASLESHVAELAYHYYQAGIWERALEFSRRAGEQALSLYSPQAAAEQFTRAIDAARQLFITPDVSLFRGRGHAYETLGEFDKARSDFESALRLAEERQDQREEWECLVSLGMLWAGQDYARTGEYYQRAFDLAATAGAATMLARSHNRIGNWHLNAEHPLDARTHHERALSAFQEIGDTEGIAETLDFLGMASYLGGDLVRGTKYYEEVVQIFRQLNNRIGMASSLATLTMRGLTYQTATMVSAVTDARGSAEEGLAALKIARDIGWRSGEAYALIFLSFSLGPMGSYSEALDHARSGLRVAEEIDHLQWKTAAHCALGALYTDILALTVAREHLEQALTMAQHSGSSHWIRCAAAYLGTVCAQQRDFPAADAALATALDDETPMETLGQRLIWAAKAECELARGNAPDAIAIVNRLVETAANFRNEGDIPRLSLIQGVALANLGEHQEAATALEAARDAVTRRGARSLQWRILVAHGDLLHAAGQTTGAAESYSATRSLIDELSLEIPEGKLRDGFMSSASEHLPVQRKPSPRRIEAERYDGLSPREREVAALVAEGKSNREISDLLVLGERTIETHVSNILAKLGFTSRAQIAAWAVAKGLTAES